jgi:DNA-binding Lrp family transcriptional regulator
MTGTFKQVRHKGNMVINDLPIEKRRHIVQFLTLRCDQHADYKLKRGSINEAAIKYNVSRKSVSRLWERAITCLRNGTSVDVSNRKIGNAGRKRISLNLKDIKKLPPRKRRTIRALSSSIGVSASTVQRRLKEGNDIRRMSSSVKPFLTEKNKIERMSFAISQIENQSLLIGEPVFNPLYDVVHIDEKWFYMKMDTERYILVKGEKPPERSCKSKHFIDKIMFISAQARPRWDPAKKKMWDGKIGMWPITKIVAAKRNSKNRPRGTLETKTMEVTKAVSRTLLIKNIIPAIRQKWPAASKHDPIVIQQDGARPHINDNDRQFVHAAHKFGMDISLVTQPPNSPDFNINDLGLFHGIQTLQQQESFRTIDQLIKAVLKSYSMYPWEKINRVFLSFQQCMIKSMEMSGSNQYIIPHMGKERLESLENLPETLTVDPDLVRKVQRTLRASKSSK